MIPSVLQDVFGTLTVGLFAASVALFFWWLVGSYKDRFFKWARENPFRGGLSGTTVVLLVLPLYGFGIIVENLTDHLTDSQKDYPLDGSGWEWTLNVVPNYQQWFLGKEGQYRFETLIRNCSKESVKKCDKKEKCNKSCKLGGLAKEYFENYTSYVLQVAADDNHYRSFVNDPQGYLNGAEVKVDIILPPNGCKDYIGHDEARPAADDVSLFECRKEVATNFINKVYYIAKNWSYRQPTYYDELQSIQRHIEYTRSSFLVATWALVFILPVLLIGMAANLIIGMVLNRESGSLSLRGGTYCGVRLPFCWP